MAITILEGFVAARFVGSVILKVMVEATVFGFIFSGELQHPFTFPLPTLEST